MDVLCRPMDEGISHWPTGNFLVLVSLCAAVRLADEHFYFLSVVHVDRGRVPLVILMAARKVMRAPSPIPTDAFPFDFDPATQPGPESDISVAKVTREVNWRMHHFPYWN